MTTSKVVYLFFISYFWSKAVNVYTSTLRLKYNDITIIKYYLYVNQCMFYNYFSSIVLYYYTLVFAIYHVVQFSFLDRHLGLDRYDLR